MNLRKLVLLSVCALFVAGATAPSYAATYLFSSDDEAEKPAAKTENTKKLGPKAKAKAEAAAKAKAKADAKAEAKAKAAKEKEEAKAKAAKEKEIADAKAEKEKLAAAKAKAKKDEQLAKAKAAKDKEIARLKAIEDKRIAKEQAEAAARAAEIKALTSLEVAKSGNNGELRSEPVAAKEDTGLFASLFGNKPKVSMLAETRALDAVLEQSQAKKKFKVKPEFMPQSVDFGGYEKGTIVIDTAGRYLYLVESSSRARRYAIAVGREGLQYKGNVTVGDKQEWPRWIPTKEMQQREPKKYGQYKDGMPGGKNNPLGARAIYLYDGKKDTHLRIHGTTAPETIGTSASNGCFRMINEHVMDLYGRVKTGTKVVVL